MSDSLSRPAAVPDAVEAAIRRLGKLVTATDLGLGSFSEDWQTVVSALREARADSEALRRENEELYRALDPEAWPAARPSPSGEQR